MLSSCKDMQGKKFLVVDDDAVMQQLVGEILSRSGGKIYTAKNGVDGLQKFRAYQPDLVILDISMPEMSGWEVCHHIRQSSNVPIIMLTSMRRESDIVRGLDEGADDYITKPFNGNVFQARIRAALRRAALPALTRKPDIYSDDYLTIDLNQRQVLVAGKPVKLTATEHRLLSYLFQNAAQTLSLDKILRHVWGQEFEGKVDYVHVYIWHLRKKLEQNPKFPRYIVTEHGIGYRFEKADARAV